MANHPVGSVDSRTFRRQFLFSAEQCPALSQWQHASVGNSHLYVHADAELTVARDSSAVVALVGFMLDPEDPARTNAEILADVLGAAMSPEAISQVVTYMAGRFVLIVSTASETIILNDPCGLRSVFYIRYRQQLYAGSQPAILKLVTPVAPDARYGDYLASAYVANSIDHWIPSGTSLYEDVHHLVPNHFIKASTAEQVRYWPKAAIAPVPEKTVCERSAQLLKRLVAAAHRRYKLALPLTAGWDSRVVLAACRDVVNDIYIYTLVYRGLDEHSDDIQSAAFLAVPSRAGDCRSRAEKHLRAPPSARESAVPALSLPSDKIAALATLRRWHFRFRGRSFPFQQGQTLDSLLHSRDRERV